MEKTFTNFINQSIWRLFSQSSRSARFQRSLHFATSNVAHSQRFRVKCPYFSTLANVSIQGMNKMCSEVTELRPEVTKLNSPLFETIFTPGLLIVQELFQRHNHEIRLCGGPVRDLLMGKSPKDIDLATTATPDEMVEMFTKEGIRMIAETGITHGTVACRIEEENFEITTLRIDVKTDGRHAEVEFTKDWMLDASRRDLTINSMFLTLDGNVIDYFNGKEDLKSKRVKFVGDAELRIAEDFLRILRYFRFFARISSPDSKHDQDTLQTIAKNVHGLGKISGERIWTELVLILSGNMPGQIMQAMKECGVFRYIGLKDDADVGKMIEIYRKSSHLSMHYCTPLAALFTDESEVDVFRDRLKLSNQVYHILSFIHGNKPNITCGPDKMFLYSKLLVSWQRKLPSAFNLFMEFLKFTGDVEAIDYFTHYKVPTFSINGQLVRQKGNLNKKEISRAINILFEMWIESNYTLSQSELLDRINPETDWNKLEAQYPPSISTVINIKKRRKF